MSTGKRGIGYGLAGMGLGGAAAVLYGMDPATTVFYPPCPFHWLTGYYCPGCGSLRAAQQLLHGHGAAALALNPLMVLSLPFVGLLFLKPRWIYQRWLPWVALGILVAYGIARNIPIWPFVWLAPH